VDKPGYKFSVAYIDDLTVNYFTRTGMLPHKTITMLSFFYIKNASAIRLQRNN
jgi:hypothetical protein